ncbi:terminase [Sinimarinibacterium sp. CAU 1509]|uniref:terminase n=1 Tax=Sinimarinibacterium sp. CAU 1509 TaxID=2562283 RepID=UPI0010AC7387|nr:terminase [Sinimarinibacterium sp. CAU 1509]TJY62185.1 terminase [Sinimarinibacterium sp. CAU 1509]
MNFDALLQAQWSDYSERHQDRINLLIHIAAVPLFWLGTINAVSALLFSGLFAALGGVLLMALALFAQGLGHDREAIQPEPFSNAWDFVQRIVAEQFITFPRFVISGQWWKNLQTAT